MSGDDTGATTTTDGNATTTTTEAPIGQSAAVVQVAGADVDGDFTPVRCTLDGDELDIEIGGDNADNAVVNRDGDTWTITGTGKYDDEDRADEVRVEVVCPV